MIWVPMVGTTLGSVIGEDGFITGDTLDILVDNVKSLDTQFPGPSVSFRNEHRAGLLGPDLIDLSFSAWS